MPQVTQGDISPSTLVNATVKASRIWADNQVNADYKAHTELMKAIRRQQTANLSVLTDPEKDREIKVTWINNCETEAEDGGIDDCDLSGNTSGTLAKTYGLSIQKKKNFTVDEMSFRTNTFDLDEFIAREMLTADKILSNTITKMAAARMESYKGTNLLTDDQGTVNTTTGDTDIPANEFDATIFAYFQLAAEMNDFASPVLVSGRNLWKELLITRAGGANANGKGLANLAGLMPLMHDLRNIDTMNAGVYKTYMLAKGAMAFASKNYYKPKPTVYQGVGQTRWSMPSRNLPGLTYDVFYTNRCEGVKIKHDFSVNAKFDFFLNPLGCNDDRTGILAFASVD